MPEHPTDAHFSFTFVFKQALRIKGNGQIYKEYTLYAKNDIKDKSTKGGS